MFLVEAPMRSQSQALVCSVTWAVRAFSTSGRSSSSSCIMVQARWALTLTLVLVALPAQDTGAAPWGAQAVGRSAGQGQHPALTDPNEQQ